MQISSQEEDLLLVEKAKNLGCTVSASKLIEKHSPLFHKMVNGYGKFLPRNLYEELLCEKWFVFSQAIREFDPKRKVKFSSFLGEKTKFRCLKEITDNKKKSSKNIRLDSSPEIENLIHSKILELGPEESDNGKEVGEINYLDFKAFLKNLILDFGDKETAEIVKERFFSENSSGSIGKTLREISKRKGVTPQAIAARIEKFLKYAKKRLTEAKKTGLISGY